MTISTYGTAFTSYDVEANNKTKEEISEEKVSFDELVTQTHEVEDVVYHTTTVEENSKPTTFIDPVTKKYVIASLENETLDKLRGKFGSDDVIEKEDGSIRLTGEAEAFVSGWFADIAYKREFLTADANGDGQLTEDEYNKTRNNFGVDVFATTEYSGKSEKLLVAGEKIIGIYGFSDNTHNGFYRNYQEFDKVNSLDDELNTTIQVDSNFDGKMSLEEAYSTKEDKDAKTVILRHLEEWGITTVPSDIDTSNFNHLLNFILDVFLQKDEKEQEKIMSRFNEMMDQGKEPTEEEVEKLYAQEQLKHIKRLDENNNLPEIIKTSETKKEDKNGKDK
ncbi:MAG: hypothetical protein DRG78_07825 [Epsilonproteobacteria bacterium]|nr:MAG: hypothetical protein DRG78_07825 [Campylobacterota bacterium]